MENRKYRVSRDNIYVGKVVETDKIYRYEGNTNFFHTKPGQLNTGSYFSYRSMLFVPNEKKLASDLLYQSPEYPILNVTDDDVCLGLGEESIVIKDACNLAPLLEYFKYNKELTFEDIMKIRKTFFTGKFAQDNCELFGWEEVKPEDWTYCENGVEVTNPIKLKMRIAIEKIHQQAGHRTFLGISKSILPEEYYNVLDEMGNNTLTDAIQWHEKMNVFAPHKNERYVKRLKRI